MIYLFFGIILAFIIGGIISEEMYETDQGIFAIFGLNPLSVILGSLNWGLSLISWFHTMNWVYPREGKSSLMGWKGWLGTGSLFSLLMLHYINNIAKQERLITDIFLLLISILFIFLLALILKRRKVIAEQVVHKKSLVAILGISLVPVSMVVVLLGIEYAFVLPFNMFLYSLFYFPVTAFVLFRKRLAI